MCRIAGLRTTSLREAQTVLKALERAAQHDTVAGRFMADPHHRDGWGVTMSNGRDTFAYRSDRPIFEDSKGMAEVNFWMPVFFQPGQEIHAIFHARHDYLKRITGGVSFPIRVSTPGSDHYIATNGSIQLKPRTRKMDFSFNNVAISVNKTSGEVSIHYLNLFNVAQGQQKAGFPEYSEGKNEYYRMYKQRLPNGTVVMSSTLATQEGIGGWPVPFGRIMRL